MARCPECVGKMEYNSSIKQLVCSSCGLSLSRHELEMYWKKIREDRASEDAIEKTKKKRKDWLDWYSKSKEDKRRF